LRNLVTLLLNPNPNISGQVESESEKNGSDPHHCFKHAYKMTFAKTFSPNFTAGLYST
jgi:hypothetical protein